MHSPRRHSAGPQKALMRPSPAAWDAQLEDWRAAPLQAFATPAGLWAG